MNNFNPAVIPLKTNIKMKKESNDKRVDNTLYKQTIGSLRYLFNTRLYICHSVILVNIFIDELTIYHLLREKRILRYIIGTLDHGILMPHDQNTIREAKIYGYSDSDWMGDQDDRKSISGYLFMLGASPISLSSNKQGIEALSSCEIVYVAASYGVNNIVVRDAI